MVEKAVREAVRREFGYRCGYCGVHEEELGSELEVDHFQPRSVGGSDQLDNLVYCCPTCNRLKGDFWPAVDPTATGRCLLHPKRDDPVVHFREEEDGRLTTLTETGAFHIERLRLNRPPLIALRRARQKMAQLLRELTAAREEHPLDGRLSQREYYDEACDPEFEITRPHGCGRLYQFLLAHKFRTGFKILELEFQSTLQSGNPAPSLL